MGQEESKVRHLAVISSHANVLPVSYATSRRLCVITVCGFPQSMYSASTICQYVAAIAKAGMYNVILSSRTCLALQYLTTAHSLLFALYLR